MFTTITEKYTTLKNWALDRFEERTTWDGIVLVLSGTAYLVIEPLAGFVALFAIGFGFWTIYTAERGKKDNNDQ